jgi:hypothetical protein
MPPDKKVTDSAKMPPPPSRSVPSKNITDTPGFKSGKTGVKRFWSNYKKILRDSFNRMSRSEQEDLIDKFALIVTVGATVVALLLFQSVMPRLVRVLGVPLALVGAWWAGRRIVGPVIIDRMSHLLKEEDIEFNDEETDRDLR